MAKPTTTKKKPLSKSEILNAVSEEVGEDVSRKHVKQIIETLVAVGHKELKKNGIFVLHGFAKFVVVKKPARRRARASTRSRKRSRRSRRSRRARPSGQGP
jgi:DNA-binding protein HU-beta